MRTTDNEYHALLARHDAMRLRQNLLSPSTGRTRHGGTTGAGGDDGFGAGYGVYEEYDDPEGMALRDQRTISALLPLVTPMDNLIAELYEALFTQHPYLRSLFPESMEFQRGHLARVFEFTIARLDQPEAVAEHFTRLGRDHRKLGVRPAHYRAFEDALRTALHRTARERWTPELDEAWTRMLRLSVASMVAGADSALAEPPSWKVTVTEHRRPAPDIAVLRVRPGEPYPVRPGQHASVESPLLPHTWRPYHVVRVPGEAGELEIHVRVTGPGGVSEALVRDARPGDTLRLGPPRGGLPSSVGAELGGDLLLVASGTGWAPAKTLLRELAGRQEQVGPRRMESVRLFLGARSPAELYDAEWVDSAERRHAWLTVTPVIGPDEPAEMAAALRRAGLGTPSPASHWPTAVLSGPPEVVGAAGEALVGMGLPADCLEHMAQMPGEGGVRAD